VSRLVTPALAALLVLAPRLEAQLARYLATGFSASQVRYVLDEPPGASERLSGVAVGGGATLTVGRLALEAGYLQARLLPDSASPAARDLVEGTLLLSVTPVRWFALKGGAHIITTVTPVLTRRWVMNEVRARLEGSLVGRTIRTHVEYRRAVTVDVNVGQGSKSVQGGEVGLTLRLARAPFWGRISYSIGQASVGPRSETLETIGVAAGFGGR
jgi:hypothetical protein